MNQTQTVVIASDHAGFELKCAISKHLAEMGHAVLDLGVEQAVATDYPLQGEAAARAVLAGTASIGIVICGTGIGISLAANKHKGIRCAICSEPFTAAMARRHNDANMLALGARVVGPGLAEMIVDAFIGASFEGGRHARRVAMISDIEDRNLANPRRLRE